ncbi:16S rRNA methyltransferase [Sinorhizobium fredii USDA 205]|uniref:Ribosomal RNA small subunit methyltransferase G n=1 Tax=Rhizobium fredii TaxID=380 RepID=A0A844AAY3_RHIFR|nr:16S rRNA (guanine(527)-N(7))-methyltransferase RsmG [Sinorhizobium fredii]AWM27006.1 rRNA small subunit 7-methylguanosine (m7G) methyltransferase GidB [Sinorhizobium fredii CCBAU 25509]KSV86474.1 16S rRNA methyltransferase [Sinorhizobium fredii USDA 205]MQW97699.1 16S rRNA (guanine(527)-N(7))-methyltransferase RsmG [Sinorhizobium fredii]MQX08796.1 16S rRNA (guanine(527)-N(7))-methyltransferase RsmG [Sinorhizobium fredii]UTY51036.1 16S rRNA (guanine(527)-N(7))-methyltransferase RsmG [Sinorhi
MKESPAERMKALRVSRETLDKLEHFAVLFQKWAKSINLVAPSTLEDLWQRHIVDSLQIIRLSPSPKTWVDLGSGGGFPGVITAICLSEFSDGWVHLVESNNKKAAFLRVALNETGARGSVHPIRVEQAPSVIPRCEAISARALADLSQLLDYCAPWMLADGSKTVAFFHKGRDYQQEIDKAVSRFQFDLVKHASVVERDSVVLEIANLSRRTK